MSDTQSAAEAASKNPAESVQVENSAHVKPDMKAEASTEDPTTSATDDAKSGDKEAANGEAKVVNTEESSPARKEKPKSDRENGGRYKSHSGKYDRGNKHGGYKFDKDKKPRHNEFENLPETDDPVEIRAQVEFYFSVQNLSTDEHLFHELEGPKNRPVSIKHLSTFTRMRRFKPYSAIVDALRDSDDLIVVDEGKYSGAGNEAVKRKEPLVALTRHNDDKYPPTTEELFQRMRRASLNKMENCVYVKGFADEGEDVGQIALEQFFRPYGSVMVRKRRDKEDHSFKGSVFVEFDSEESQQQFLALDPKPKFNDRDLLIMSKKDYSEMKCKEKGITPAWMRDEEYTSTRGNSRRGRGRGDYRGRGGRGGRGGRYHDRDHKGGDRFGRDRSRDRGDHRRDRSRSRSSEDRGDWNRRRDRFQSKKDSRKGDEPGEEERKPIERDAYGVPIVQDTRTTEEKGEPKKRKADDSERVESTKKSKIEIKEDE